MADAAPILAVRRRLALNARRAREELGWTQEDAAERIDCSVQALQRMERASAAVTIDYVARLAAAYRLDVTELVGPSGPWIPPRVGRPPGSGVQASRAAERRGPNWRRR